MSTPDAEAVSSGPADDAGGHRLVLLRHAKSSWLGDQPDVQRPLATRGQRDADAVGRWLAAHDEVPDRVLCSPAVRTRETWARVVAAGGKRFGAPVSYVDAVYEAWPDTLLDLVRGLAETTRTAVLVGHAPGLPGLAARLHQLSGEEPLGDFPTSAVAVFEVSGRWAGAGPGSARLVAYAVPRG